MAAGPQVTGTIKINGYIYDLSGLLVEQYLSRLPGKVNIGSDSYDKENYLSNWIQKDRRGGMLIDEMDEAIHTDRFLWSNCITDLDGHLVLPRKATKISTFNGLTQSSTVRPDSYEDEDSDWSNEANAYDNDTGTDATHTFASTGYCGYLLLKLPQPEYCDQIRVHASRDNAAITTMQVDVLTDSAWSNVYSDTPAYGDWETISLSPELPFAQIRIRFTSSSAGVVASVDEVDCRQADYTVSGTPGPAANFNGELYWAIGKALVKLDSGRASFTTVAVFDEEITALIPSLNSKLYILLGDTCYYCHMDTNEDVVLSTTGNAYWGIQKTDMLWKINTSGTTASSADPDEAAPTWNDEGDITDIADQIETFFIGPNADGNDVIYCATNSVLKIYDETNDDWLDTKVRLPNHPNGGKGAAFWNDAIYLSYGLGVKKYVFNSGATTSDLGLDRYGGLLSEYNGEIVKFCPDSQYVLLALVGADQTSGNSSSGVYAWNGRAWSCWWTQHELFESYTTNDDDKTGIQGVNWYAQSFTPSTSHTIERVRLKLYRIGSPGDLTVSIQAVDGSNHPDGTDLCSGTIDGNSLTTDTGGLWYEIYLGSGTALTASTMYTIVCRTLTGSSGNNVQWRMDASSPSYTSGQSEYSTDSGSSWTGQAAVDFMFEEYGVEFNEAMHDIIVSSAESGYAVYWDCGGDIYYMDIPRGLQNPKQLSGTQNYEPAGIFLSSWFDAGTAAFKKLAKAINSYCRGITTTETINIKYRLNHEYEDRDTGWTSLVMLDTSAENGAVETLLASGAGLAYDSLQYRLELMRGSTATATPDLLALVTAYMKLAGSANNKAWRFNILINGKHRSIKEQYDDIWTALTTDTLIPIYFRNDDTPHYVKLMLETGETETGVNYRGQMSLSAIEV